MFFIAMLLCAHAAWAQLPVPELTGRVIDQTGTLDAIEAQGLEERLAALEQDKGSQMVFLIVPTTQPEDIASYANRVANTWKVGRKDVGDGVLLVVAKNDRKVRIEVAKTLEGAIPDLAAKQVIDTAITPNFRQGDYAGGLRAAADQLIARISGEALPEPEVHYADGGEEGFQWLDFAIFLFFLVPIGGALLRGLLGRKLGSLVASAGAGAVALFVTSSMIVACIAAFVALLVVLFSSTLPAMGSGRRGSSGGGGWSSGGSGGWSSGSSSSSSGGFSSGGGGDFGGGGASGDW